MKTFNPLQNFVSVEMESRKTESEGGIALPEMSQGTASWGVVTGAGPEVEELIEGDEVFVPSHLGTHIIAAGKDFVLVRESDVRARKKREGEE